jgi:isopentenyl diphosphate isomerase/L-lactate dehydrogenase-like FMN-dependent dehydrogenase/rubredoxin
MVVYICNVCNLYIFDESQGDSKSNIAANSTIDGIPDSWRCPVCEAKKDSLKKLPEGEITAANKKYQDFLATPNNPKGKQLTLAEVRKNALEKLKGICSVNKVCDGLSIRLCQGQKYGQPIGLGGAGKGLSFAANVDALDRIKLKQRLITTHVEPDMGSTIYNQNLSIPIMPSSLSGVNASMGGSISEMEFAKAVLKGSKAAGTIGWIGNTSDDGQELTGIEAVKEVGLGIPIFKPQEDERLLELLEMAENAGAVAVGVDLDGVGSTNWERAGKPVYRKTVAELSELAGATNLPFIAKSIMSVEDALDAMDAGVDGIDVSNHGGRILDSTRGVAEVLPKIVKAVKGKITVTAGGGVRTGFDVLKLLALGADGILVGRDIVRAVLGGGAEGVKLHFDYLKSDLRRGMLLTSCNSIEEIDERIFDLPIEWDIGIEEDDMDFEIE